ncbi:ABC transporter permease [Actinokineospora fastidiosa]|uniref:ABC transporter permease n=1 Tax=Actinokineospora fastidiosa TaxID=1816 RepID=A0A918LD42_9PSEU|nr:ABC transporter permease [Actinokineospora fastidiosa]GGS31037.1 hypothetical protein GCM10010171_26070 [Actinokineospora fastidiosa]
MYWMTYRQHRTQLLVSAALLAVIGAVLLINGLLASGAADPRESFKAIYVYLSWLPVAPIAVGVFWGTPLLAAEFERGTHRLAWTQSVSRARWLAVKLGTLGLAVAVAGGVFGLMVQAWIDGYPTVRAADRFGDIALFSMTGVAAPAWWLFGFAVGTAAGALLRRTLPAIAVTIVIFVLVMVGLFRLREDYAEPVEVRIDHQSEVPHGMIVGTLLDAEDNTVGLRVQPADRYWRFQWTEAGILLAAAALLTGATAVAVRRRP